MAKKRYPKKSLKRKLAERRESEPFKKYMKKKLKEKK